MTATINTDQSPADAIGPADNASAAPFDSALFGPPPLLAGEDPDEYMALFRGIFTTVQPKDIFERSWVRHMSDLMWEMRRFRRIITQLIDLSDQQGLEEVLRRLVQEDSMEQLLAGTNKSEDLARRYSLKEAAAVTEVDGLLASAGLSWDAVKAEAAAQRTSEIERLNRLVMTAAARVNSTLRELERRRADLAKRLRRAVQQVEAADAGPVGAGRVDAGRANNSADRRLAA
jgi:phosphopantetheinyl transferase (holo-ACP synthase)